MAKALLLVALALVGCREERSSKWKVVVVNPDRDASLVAFGAQSDAPAPDAAVPDASIDERGPSDVLLTDDKQSVHLRWGRAFYGADGFFIQLYSSPKNCDNFSPLDNDFTGSRIQLVVLPGPGGRFYTGKPFGTDVLVQSDVIPLVLGPADVELRIPPFRTEKGQHIRGTIEASQQWLIGSAALKGAFDVEICDGPDEIYALQATAPARAASGRFDGKPVTPRTVHAIVYGAPVSKDEAIDVAIKRKPRGSSDRVVALAFYAAPNVPCDDDYRSEPAPLVDFVGISGTSAAHPILHSPQPMIGSAGDLPLHGWVTFDSLAFTQGAKITGTLWAQPAMVWDRKKGGFGGRFTATVCLQ